MPQRSPRPFFAPLTAVPAVAGFPAGAPAPLFDPDRRRSERREPTRRTPPASAQWRPVPSRRAERGRSAAAPGGAISGRLAVAAVAAGALATAGHGIATGLDAATTGETALASDSLALASAPTATSPSASGPDAAVTDVLPVSAAPRAAPARQADALAKSTRMAAAAAAPAAAPAAPARAPGFVKPAQGTFTSGFGSRWGTSHQGVDIANAIGTPIVSVADGVVTAAGPASGFGQWVKVRLADGTETVYGHVNRFFVSTGDTVKAGQRIAEIGNRGQSTGPHLHFEVHTPSGKKINPLPWLAERGISLGAQQD